MAKFYIKVQDEVYTVTSRVVLHPVSFKSVLAFRGNHPYGAYMPLHTVFAVTVDDNNEVSAEDMIKLHPVIVSEVTREIEEMLMRKNNKFEYIELNAPWNDAIKAAADLVWKYGDEQPLPESLNYVSLAGDIRRLKK